jgi:hypothetical protein
MSATHSSNLASGPGTVGAVDKALDVLEALIAGAPRMSLGAIAAAARADFGAAIGFMVERLDAELTVLDLGTLRADDAGGDARLSEPAPGGDRGVERAHGQPERLGAACYADRTLHGATLGRS